MLSSGLEYRWLRISDGTSRCGEQQVWPVVAGSIVAAGAWVFLVRFWRPHRLIEALYARLRSLDISNWWPALAAFGDLLNRPRPGEREVISDYAIHLIGEKRWALLTEGADPRSLIPYTRPRWEIFGTPEYEAAHPQASGERRQGR